MKTIRNMSDFSNNMNPNEINKRIAIACGWKQSWDTGGMEIWIDKEGTHWLFPSDYYGDLNAMHEAESQMKDYTFFSTYERILEQLMGGQKKVTWPFHASASQRAEAFLRTIGQWEEAE